MLSALANALTGLNAASRSFAGTAHNIAHYGAIGGLADDPVSPVAPPSDRGPFRLFDTVNSSLGSGGVKADQFVRAPSSVPLYAPQSPFANSEGLVALANVSLENEIVDSIRSRAMYMANLRAIDVADDMLGELLDRRL